MKRKIARRLYDRQQRLARRLRKASRADNGPTLPTTKITYDLAERTRAIGHGGLGAVLNVVNRLKLAAVIDAAVKVLKAHRPYHESDHVLNIAYNILCGGRVLDDIERLRNDEVHLDALGVETIPDPDQVPGTYPKPTRDSSTATVSPLRSGALKLISSSTDQVPGTYPELHDAGRGRRHPG